MTQQSWPLVTLENGTAALGPAALQELVEGRIALVRFKGALAPDVAAHASAAVLGAQATVNRYSNAALTTVGPYLANRLSSPAGYFAEATRTDQLFPEPGRDPRAIARNLLAETFGLRALDVLSEPGEGPYAPAVARVHADGVSNPLHNDHIARDAVGSGLRVAAVSAQLSCVVCLQECGAGGELEVFRRPWSPEDEAWKVRGGLGYRDEVVAGAPRLRFAPATGDIYVLNPTLYHAIVAVSGRTRVTLGFFFGLFADRPGEAFAWS